jgi:AraC-like DNA-binding protein
MISFNILGVTVSLAIFKLGYHGLKQTAIITLPPKASNSESAELPPDLVQSLTDQLNMLMQKEKLYKVPELNLEDLAKKLDTSRNILSQFINECLQTNFFDYINGLRVEEMKRLLLDTEKEYMTIYALAVEAGFSAKSTYNRIFKQFTGMTPSEFRQKHCPWKTKNQTAYDSYQKNDSTNFIQN